MKPLDLMVTFVLWLMAPSLVLGLIFLVQKIRRPGRVRRRSEDHEAYLRLLTDILDQPPLVALMVRQGTTTLVSLSAFRSTMGRLNEPMLRACAAKLLSDRLVRRQVARFLQERGMPRKRALGALGEIAAKVR